LESNFQFRDKSWSFEPFGRANKNNNTNSNKE